MIMTKRQRALTWLEEYMKMDNTAMFVQKELLQMCYDCLKDKTGEKKKLFTHLDDLKLFADTTVYVASVNNPEMYYTLCALIDLVRTDVDELKLLSDHISEELEERDLPNDFVKED